MADITQASICEILRQLGHNELSHQELLDQYQKKFLCHEKDIQAWTEYDLTEAYIKARKLDADAKETSPILPLRGIPFGAKDIFNAQGFRNEMGSATRRNYRPGNDARCIALTKSSGSLLLGKTTTAEFAVHSLLTKDTRNPLNPNWQPGTSSTGSAAAVAAAMIPWALATQTAGSITRPSTYCGVVGFKPSFGAVPRTGILKTSDTLDSVGIIARRALDLPIVFESIRLSGRDYPFWDAQAPSNESPESVHIRIMTTGLSIFDQYDTRALSSFKKAVEKLDSVGVASFSEFAAPSPWNRIHAEHELLYGWSLRYYLRREFGQEPKAFSPALSSLIDAASVFTLDDYRRALQYQEQQQAEVSQRFPSKSFVLTPSTAGYIPSLDSAETDDANLIFSYLGLPTISIPYYIDGDVTPLSLLLVGPPRSDKALMNVAQKLESALADSFCVSQYRRRYSPVNE